MTKAQRQAAHTKRIERLKQAQQVVMQGTCPDCGTKLYENNAIYGWFVCGHRGATGFQRESGPHCDFQIFYDPTPAEFGQIRGAN